MEHLPVIQVIVPLLAAPLCALVRKPRATALIAIAATWVSLWVSLQLLQTVLATGSISYAMGGWAAPYGIEYRVDTVSAFVLLIVSGIGAVVTPYALTSVKKEVADHQIGLFYTAWLLCFAGLLGITITGDVFNVFVFLEISSLSAYALIAMGEDRRALTAAYQYLIMGAVGATFIVIGIGMMYVMTGTLNMADLAERLPAVAGTRTIPVAFGFLTVGITLKLALFPLHLWLPNAYTYAPSAVTSFLASTATKVAVYMLLRFFFTVFGAAFAFDVMQLDMVLMPLAIAAIFSMSLVAIFQSNVKRMMAYSSVAQIGYMILGISMASVTGLTAGILHLFNHAVTKGALFMALGCVMYSVGSVELSKMRGLGKRMPWTMAAFVGGGLSLIGVPLTAGFVSKWYLLLAALDSGMWWIAVFILIASLMAIVYVWRIVEVAYFSPSPDGAPTGEAPLSMLIPTWVLVLANFYFGIDTRVSVGAATRAAEYLLGAGP